MSTRADLTIDQGATFNQHFLVKDEQGNTANLSGYTGSSEMRRTYSSTNSYSITCNVYSNGMVALTMDAVDSVDVPEGRYYYDVNITDANSVVYRILEGAVTVTPGVTRDG